MDEPIDSHLASIPWVAALINDPHWTAFTVSSRTPKASTEDSFFAETLKTDRTIRALHAFQPTPDDNDKVPCKELRAVVEIGDGVNGYPQVCHGGFVATMMDELIGALILLNAQQRKQRLRKEGKPYGHVPLEQVTAYLNVTYKRAMPTPGVVLCAAKLVREDGRKSYVHATVGDGTGVVYARAESLFIGLKPSL